jgi:hypothetical protein
MAVVMVTMAATTVKTATVMVKTVATLKTVAAVMTTAEKTVVDVTDEKGGGRRHIGGNAGS